MCPEAVWPAELDEGLLPSDFSQQRSSQNLKFSWFCLWDQMWKAKSAPLALTHIFSGNRLVSLSLNINICLGSGPTNPETEHFVGLSTRNLKILINSIRDLHNYSTLLYSQYTSSSHIIYSPNILFSTQLIPLPDS